VSTQTLWIVIAVVVVVLIVAVGLGLWLRGRRRISLREAAKPEVGTGTGTETEKRRGGTYSASGGFDFTSGGATATEEPPPVEERAPIDPAPVDTARVETATPDTVERAPQAPPVEPVPTEAPVDPARVEAPPTGSTRADTVSSDTVSSDTVPSDGIPVETVPSDTVPQAAPEERPTDGSPFPAVSAPAPAVDPDAVAAATPRPTEEIEPAEGRLVRLRGRLSRSRSGFGQGLLGLLGAGELDEESWEDVEAMLLQADLGPETTLELVETLRTELARRAVRTPAQARDLLREVLTDALRSDLDRSVHALPHDGRPAVLLVVGVNGTGKTTTTGKLARVLVGGGRHVVLGAADTFRAAAAEQLATWGERAGATVVRGAEGADPASVAFDAVKRGAEEGADAVLLDTAGRLHTKTGLMDELGKVKRVVERQAEIDEVLLVLDATTGQNGLIQARVFGDVVKVTGIALTKLDGTAKGGIVFRVQRELGVPVKLVGLGEGADDLAPFEPAAFVDALLD
jgi:fused signal recognition particle receptor